MANLNWQILRNLQNSLTDFLREEVDAVNLTVPDLKGNPQAVQIRTGFEKNDDWKLPVVSLYDTSKVAPRLSVGSNKRQKAILLIIDIRALDVGSQIDLTDWVEKTINDGWDYYEYSPNVSDPDNPIKVKKGYVSIEFLSNVPVRLGDNVDAFDKYRQNITINCTITGVC